MSSVSKLNNISKVSYVLSNMSKEIDVMLATVVK